MAKLTGPMKAAVIAGIATILAAVIGVVGLLLKPPGKVGTTAQVTGDTSTAIAIGGNVSGANIIVSPQAQQQGGITPEARRIVEEILASSASKKPTGRHDFSDELAAGPTEALTRDPYNVRALIIRGQGFYSGAKNFGALRFREALNDFEKVAQIDKKLADPHFGIGTVLYQLAIFDLADRGLYKIHEKGEMRFDRETAAMRIRPPSLEPA